MASVYPGGLDALNTGHVDSVGEVIHASDINNLADGVNKIEAELGISPKGTFSTVASKLNALYYGTVTTAGRNAITAGNRPPGLTVFNSTTNHYEFNSGSDAVPVWQAVGQDLLFVNANIDPAAAIDVSKLAGVYTTYVPAITSIGSTFTLGNGIAAGRYLQIGKMVTGRATIQMGSTTSFGTGSEWDISLPINPNNTTGNFATRIETLYFDASGGGFQSGFGYYANTPNKVILYIHPGTVWVDATHPWTWAVNDVVIINFTYEAA